MKWSELKHLIDNAIGEAGFDDAYIDYIDISGGRPGDIDVKTARYDGVEHDLEISVF